MTEERKRQLINQSFVVATKVLDEAALNLRLPGSLTSEEDEFLRHRLRAFARVFEIEFTG